MKKKAENDQMQIEGTEEAEILSRLAAKVETAIKTIQELRRERDELRTRLETAESELSRTTGDAERLGEIQSENERFKGERDEIRERIERILGSLESLDELTAE